MEPKQVIIEVKQVAASDSEKHVEVEASDPATDDVSIPVPPKNFVIVLVDENTPETAEDGDGA